MEWWLGRGQEDREGMNLPMGQDCLVCSSGRGRTDKVGWPAYKRRPLKTSLRNLDLLFSFPINVLLAEFKTSCMGTNI